MPKLSSALRALITACAFVALNLSFTPRASAQSPTVLAGTVHHVSGEAAQDVLVRLPELARTTRTDSEGRFSLAGVPTGSWLLEVVDAHTGTSVVDRVYLTSGGALEVELVLDPTIHRDEIVVTAGRPRGRSEIAQPVSVITEEELDLRTSTSLGDSLDAVPGVHAQTFGAGASRPVVRGLGGDRVRMLQNGLGTGDVSASSPDHAVASDVFSAQRVEILRGPSTLLYGSGAIGGVVNVLDETIPRELPTAPASGEVALLAGTGAAELSRRVEVSGGRGHFAWSVGAFSREAEDYEIPSGVDGEGHDQGGHREDGEGIDGVLENSFVESEGFSLGGSWVGDRGFFGVSVSEFDSDYGLPGHEHAHGEEHGGEHDHEQEPGDPQGDEHGEGHAHEHGEDPAMTVLEQRRISLAGALRRPFAGGRELRWRAGHRDYEHVEAEGASIGTRFLREGWEARVELLHEAIGPFEGIVGVSFDDSDFEATGAEGFTPPTESTSMALFAVEEWESGPWSWELGLRWETAEVEAAFLLDAPAEEPPGKAGDHEELPLGRSFDAVSASVSAVYDFGPSWSLAGSLSRNQRAPGAVELYSNGPHVATSSFEIGDPFLDLETALGFDLTLRRTQGLLTGEVTAFRTDFEDFLYQSFTGDEAGGLAVLEWRQADAELTGVEVHADLQLLHNEPHHLTLELTADTVDADLGTGGSLPRIPPRRAALGLRYNSERWRGLVEMRWIDDATDVAEFEEPTDGYTMVNLFVGYRLVANRTIHDFLLRGTNLTNELARNHLSLIKEVVPLPGRDVSLLYRLRF